MYKEFSDSLVSEVRKQQGHILLLNKQNSSKTSEILLLKENLSLKDSISKTKEERIELLNKTIKSEQAKKAKSFFVGTGIGVVISTIVVLLTGLHK